MEVVMLIQPHEFGDNFIFEDGKWKVKFPPTATSGIKVSNDANNLITLGDDNGMFIDATQLHAYALVQDDEDMKIHLYRHQAGLEFDVASATLISSIDMVEMNGRFDDIAITEATVTFKDVQTETELVIDTEQLQKSDFLDIYWPLSGEKDDKLKVGATDRIELTLVSSKLENQNDFTDISIFDFTEDGYVISWYYEGPPNFLVNELNANIEPKYSKTIGFENVSVTESDLFIETKIAIINYSEKNLHLEINIQTQRGGDIDESVKEEITGSPSYVWNAKQSNHASLDFYLAAKDTVIEDNGISPTARIVDLYIPKYLGDSFTRNALTKTPEGLLVKPGQIDTDHTLEAYTAYNEDVGAEIEVQEFTRRINGNEMRIPAVTLRNAKGKTLAAIIAKIPNKLETAELQ